MMNFAFKTRNCVSKNEELCIKKDEFCRRGVQLGGDLPERRRLPRGPGEYTSNLIKSFELVPGLFV